MRALGTLVIVVLALAAATGCGGDSAESGSSVPTTQDAILQDMGDCLERAGAVVTTNPAKLELEARWEASPDGFVGVSVGNYYESGDERVYFPVTLRSGRLRESDEAAAENCMEKYEDGPSRVP